MTRWLIVKQPAECVRMGKPTVYSLIHEDRLPFHKALIGYRFDDAGPSESNTATR